MRIQLIALLVSLPLAVLAHGDWPPRHGGTMNVGGETSFEMVRHRNGMTFHMSDHGEDLPTAGSQAVLTVGQAGEQRRYEGQARGSNELHFPGARVARGEAAVVKATLGNGAIVVGRFPAQQAAASARP